MQRIKVITHCNQPNCKHFFYCLLNSDAIYSCNSKEPIKPAKYKLTVELA
ncbi:hypothetical protein WKT22_04375 [Candidatus Lokiarchaeum ossiferum]